MPQPAHDNATQVRVLFFIFILFLGLYSCEGDKKQTAKDKPAEKPANSMEIQPVHIDVNPAHKRA